MADWWTTVLGQVSDRHVIGPAEVAGHLPTNVLTQLTQSTTDQDDIALETQIRRDIQADAVLFGRVVSKPPQKAFWGSKERYPKRLYLYLVSGALRQLCEHIRGEMAGYLSRTDHVTVSCLSEHGRPPVSHA